MKSKIYKYMAILTITLTNLLISSSVFAQSPQKMSYQAVIRDAGNVLVTSHAVGMRISILQGSVSGTVVYTETQTPTTNANGLVTIEIGVGTGFDAINWASGPYFIKTETDPTGGTNYTAIVGTSQLLSVPYAMFSKTSQTADYNSLTNLPNLSVYLTTELDPVFGVSPAHGITNKQVEMWTTAFGWGDHAGLYRPIGYVPAWSEITGKPNTTSGYGITDAVTIAANQTITGIKTFSKDLLINTLTVGRGKGDINTNTAIGAGALYTNTTGSYNTANGYNALYYNTTGNSNTANGYGTLYDNTTGSSNTANGYDALLFNTTGSNNTANGFDALYSNTTGYNNTANGDHALFNNTTGTENTATGQNALLFNLTGSDNTANGNYTLYSNTTGYYNTAIGAAALYTNTTGNDNTAIGVGALQYNTTGSYNTANGRNALYSNTTGYSNTANGFAALRYSTTSFNNTANGDHALFSNTTGSYNAANGSDALYSNTTGYENTANGYNALYANTTGSDNTANGFYALLNNTTGYYNTANGYEALLHNTTGGDNIANGSGALVANTTGTNNTAEGNSALYNNITGSYNTAIGYNADVASGNLTNATAIGYNAKVNASNKVRIGNSSVTVIEGQVNWSVGSDIRLKDNIEYSDKLGLEFVNGLKTATFTYKNDSTKRLHDGLIAQDVKKSLDQLGLKFSGLTENENEEKILNLSYAEFVIPLINSVKELSNKNQDQQKQIDELKALVKSLINNQAGGNK